MEAAEYVGIGLVVIGALMVSGILALIPTCGLSFGVCLIPITFFGLNPNLVLGVVLVGSGAFLFIRSRMEAEG